MQLYDIKVNEIICSLYGRFLSFNSGHLLSMLGGIRTKRVLLALHSFSEYSEFCYDVKEREVVGGNAFCYEGILVLQLSL